MNIYKTDVTQEYYTQERCHIIEILNLPQEYPNLSIARARVEVGIETQLHSLHQIDETYYVLEGTGLLTVGNEQKRVGRGDCILIQKGVAQKILNDGSNDLIFLCICLPGFRPESYQVEE